MIKEADINRLDVAQCISQYPVILLVSCRSRLTGVTPLGAESCRFNLILQLSYVIYIMREFYSDCVTVSLWMTYAVSDN